MTDKIELTLEQMNQINGRTLHESCDLMFALAGKGYGPFIKVNKDRDDLLDIEGMQAFFAERGYKFIPAFSDDQQNMFIAPDGMPYGNDYVIYLLKNDQL